MDGCLNPVHGVLLKIGGFVGYIRRSGMGREADKLVESEYASAACHALIQISTVLAKLREQARVTFRHVGTTSTTYCLGEVTLRSSRTEILRGYVDFLQTFPVGGDIPEVLALCLLAIPTLTGKLARENHSQFGYHYHYVDAAERRSNTILTFENRVLTPHQPTLDWEYHAEGKAEFDARVERWRTKKRKSIYSVCLPDAKKWPLAEFKTPSKEAAPVWPWAGQNNHEQDSVEYCTARNG
jgi:hypothetical protein